MPQAKKKHRSNPEWIKRHVTDPYVKRSVQEGYRSRAAYKLTEIADVDRLLKPGMTVVDLGAAPGGWSQYAAARVSPQGRVIALDILPMDPLQDVVFIQGDFTEDVVLQQLEETLAGARVDLVMSDMSPNISGNRSVDQPRSMYLVELAFDLATRNLASGGAFVAKVFQGEGYDEILALCRKAFGTVKIRKPAASRQESRETFIVASGFRL